jgi:hypothetical protein
MAQIPVDETVLKSASPEEIQKVVDKLISLRRLCPGDELIPVDKSYFDKHLAIRVQPENSCCNGCHIEYLAECAFCANLGPIAGPICVAAAIYRHVECTKECGGC